MHAETTAPRSRLPWYAAANGAFTVLVGVMAFVGPSPDPRALYLCVLFALCSTPILFARTLNGPYAILCFFAPVLFVFYGMADLSALFSGVRLPPQGFLLSETEAVILCGAAMLVLGYRLALLGRPQAGGGPAKDWPPALLVLGGLSLWAAGTVVSWYWNIFLIVRSSEFVNTHGQLATAAMLMAKLMQPVGILILAYAQLKLRSRTLLLALIAIAAFQVAFGFASNTKSGAMMAGILIIMASLLVRGRIPLGWMAAAVAFVVFAFPVFQAYRQTVVGEHGASNASTARDLGAALRLTLESMKSRKTSPLDTGAHAESFFERSSMKPSVDMIVRRTGTEVPYQHGYTLIPALTAFIPRFIWPTKLDVQTGQLLNKQFHVSEAATTYISPSHLGEMYWNFGWAGVIVGMLLLGLLLGRVNRACDLSRRLSVTRLLILAITVQQLVVRFEGTISSEYAIWMRSLGAVLLLHLLLARPVRTPLARSSAPAPSSARVLLRPAFPNLLR